MQHARTQSQLHTQTPDPASLRNQSTAAAPQLPLQGLQARHHLALPGAQACPAALQMLPSSPPMLWKAEGARLRVARLREGEMWQGTGCVSGEDAQVYAASSSSSYHCLQQCLIVCREQQQQQLPSLAAPTPRKCSNNTAAAGSACAHMRQRFDGPPPPQTQKRNSSLSANDKRKKTDYNAPAAAA